MISKITSRNVDSSSQSTGDGGGGSCTAAPPPKSPASSDQSGAPVLKSGPLFLSSKGIGWTTWKKRWFILTRTSLVFFRTDPKYFLGDMRLLICKFPSLISDAHFISQSVVPQKGSELNLTLGGIDLNDSGSVVVKADKKLLTVLFPDGGREGRAFTLKTETLEDLYEWKTALENALAEAPNVVLATGQNDVLPNESDTKNGSSEQTKDRQPAKSTVIGRPVLLALEEVDGSPSFLEKALRFIEEHGIKVEGILRQAADVEHVEHRIREYEQGKTEFSPEEDAHVIADCVKYIIRELPSYPVPVSCCNALLEACRNCTGADRNTRAKAMRVAICETFPDPNRKLLQRILIMMQIVASHKNQNLMAPPAVAACMAPLLLRPLLSGDCEIENDFDVGGDGSMQLLQAAAAANHAQAIVITLLEEYNKIFGESSISPELYDSDESGSEGEEATDDDGTGESDSYSGDENGSCSGSCDSGDDDVDDEKDLDAVTSGSKSLEVHDDHKARQKPSNTLKTNLQCQHEDGQVHENVPNQVNNSPAENPDESAKLNTDSTDSSVHPSYHQNQNPMMHKSTTIINERGGWGRASTKKNHSMESIHFNLEDENDIQNLEAAKADLQKRVSKEVEGNETLQARLEERKEYLDEHPQDLVQEVIKLRKQLLKEKSTRMALKAVLKNPMGPIPDLSIIDEKTKAEIEELAQAELEVAKLKDKVDDLVLMLKREQKDTEASATRRQGTSSEGAATEKELANSTSGSSNLLDKPPPANLKKSKSKGEQAGSTASALSKLTTRLNFLKERRSQIASEIQYTDKGRGSGQSAVQHPENRQRSDQNPERGK